MSLFGKIFGSGKGAKSSLAGTSWVGTSEWAGVVENPLTEPCEIKLRLKRGGSVAQEDRLGPVTNKATWRQKGNRVVIEKYSGREVGWRFEGTVEGNRLTGTEVEVSDTDRRWKFSLRRTGRG